MSRIGCTWVLLVTTACTGAISGGAGEGADDDSIDGWGGNLPDSDDPVTPTAQKLTIEVPARGAMIPASSAGNVEVAGQILDYRPDEALTINDQKVEIGADGRFSAALPARMGANVIVATLTGVPGARAQRTFLYGEFGSIDDFVPAAAALRINEEGFSDSDGELDDISSVVSAALAERDPIKMLPASYSFNMAVVGTVNVSLLERTSGPAKVVLTPRNGGVHAVVRLPNVRIRHRLTFNCAITTCNTTGTVTADSIEVAVELDAALRDNTIEASSHDGTIDIVNFKNQQDGTLASLAQDVVEFFVPDLERRIENVLQPGVNAATSADFAVALDGLAVPANIDLRPALDFQLELSQEFDTLSFANSGALMGLAVRARPEFDASDPGAGAPGWLAQGGAVGDYRLDPPFGVSSALDLVNQLLFAVWGQGALALRLPLGDLGDTGVTVLAPPVLIPERDREGLVLFAGDILLDTTYNGEPIQLAVTVVTRAQLVADAGESRARVELIDKPVLYAEMVDGPDAFTGLVLTTLIENTGPKMVGEIVGAIQVPLPALPLDAIADSLAGKQLRIAPPAEFVTGEPPARVTLYGRFAAQ